MKRLLVLILVLTLPMIAIAGPEDHTPAAVYKTSANVPYYLMSFVFDTANVSNDGENLELDARYGSLRGQFKIVSSSRHNEERVRFTAEKVFINKWESGCGEGEVAKIIIQGEDHASFGVDVTGLSITVEYTTTNDTCHSRPVTEVLKYELAQ